MATLRGKKFLFACIAVYCVTCVAMYNNFSGEIYRDIVLGICGIFTIGQTWVDVRNGHK